jgi:peptide/nickel transport system substrate-binding protein
MKRSLFLSVLAALALFTCSVNAETLRWSSVGDVATLDPAAHNETFTNNFLLHIYESLIRRDRNMQIEPALATSWERIGADRWRFKLRRDVTFHEGETFNADDVVASVARMLDPASRAAGNFPSMVRAERVDDYTVDIILKGPYPLLLNDLCWLSVMSKSWMEKHDSLKPGNVATGTTTYASTHANGTGPFKLESYQPDSKTVLVVNDKWWDKPAHNLTRIEFRPIKSDATRVAALLSGELDMIAPAPLQDLKRIAAVPGFKVVEEPSLRLIFLGLNWRPELIAEPGQKNPLLDLRVRQALWHSIDTASIQSRIMRGKAKATGTLVAPQIAGYDSKLAESYGYDPELAKKLLAEAGYPKGFKVGLACSNDRFIADEQICLAIGAMWARVGVQAVVKAETRANFFPRVDRGETDIYLYGWANLPTMDSISIISVLLSSRKDGYGGNNPNGLVSPRIDEIARAAAVELDEGKRLALLQEALKIARDQVLLIPLHLQPVAWATKSNVDVPQFPDEYVRLWFAHLKM